MSYHVDRPFDLTREEQRRAGKPEPKQTTEHPYEDPNLTDDDVRAFRNGVIGGSIGGLCGGPIGAVIGAVIGSRV